MFLSKQLQRVVMQGHTRRALANPVFQVLPTATLFPNQALFRFSGRYGYSDDENKGASNNRGGNDGYH